MTKNPMRRNLLYLVLALLLSMAKGMAQPYCTIRNFSIRDGLAANRISMIEQTQNDIMWFSTWNGLCYFDGYRFSTFRNTMQGDNILSTNRLLSAHGNYRDDIWCLSYDHQVYLFDTRRGTYLDISAVIAKRYGRKFATRTVFTLPNGHTWVASLPDDDDLYCITDSLLDEDARGVRHLSKKALGVAGCKVTSLQLDKGGHEWILTNRGLVCDGKRRVSTLAFEHMQQVEDKLFFATADGHISYCRQGSTALKSVPMPLGISRINALLPYGENMLLIATDRGIRMLNTDRLTTRTIGQETDEVVEMYLDRQQRLWAFTGEDKLTLVNPQTGQAIPPYLQTPTYSWYAESNSKSNFWHQDQHGTVWVIPKNGGICYYDERRGCMVPYALQTFEGNPFFFSNLEKCLVDKHDNLWVVGINSLAVINFKYRSFMLHPTLPGVEMRAVAMDAEGRCLAGDKAGHLFVFDRNKTFLGYMSRDGSITAAPVRFTQSGGVYALRLDSRQRLWIGTKGDGLYMWDKGKMSHFQHDARNRWSLSDDNIYDVDEDNRGNVWIASFERGINLLLEDERGIRFANVDNQMRQFPGKQLAQIRRITHTPDGVIIASTNKGLITFSNKFSSPSQIKPYITQQAVGDTASLLSGTVLQTLCTHDGKVYVATTGGGIQQVASPHLLSHQLKMRSLPQFSEEEGNVQSMVEDAEGKLWVVRESTLDCYDPEKGYVSPFGPNDLDGNCDFTEAKPFFDPQHNEICLSVVGAYLSFSPQHVTKHSIVPNIVFTNVLYQGEQTPRLIMGSKTLELPSDRRNVTVSFSAIDYTDNYLVKYAYKLEGLDHKWNYTTSSHSASLSNLPAGRYRLLVRSTNRDGEWMDNQQELEIYVHPTFSETVWAKLLYLLLALGAIGVVLYIWYLHNRNKADKRLSAIKMQFFADMGHKLRTPLTLIGGPATDILNHEPINENTRNGLEMIQRNSRTMLQMVNDMLDYNMEGKNYFVDDERAPVFAVGQQETGGSSQEKRQDLTLLIVEDNADLRAFLAHILRNNYHILTAENGRKGLEISRREQPDFIITDVMMPEMDGITMVHELKQNKETSHIPVIVLSAKASLEDKLSGLKEGIDDYITKPFSATYLIQRVENIIGQRRILQQQVMEELLDTTAQHATAQLSQPAATPAEYRLSSPHIVDADKEMMQTVMKYLEEHIGDESLKMEDLATAVNLSYVVFLEKIKNIVGMTAKNFVQSMRMQRAEELIAGSKQTFSEIAYAVGYNDPKYFGKCFRKATGMSPSEYRKKSQESNLLEQTDEKESSKE